MYYTAQSETKSDASINQQVKYSIYAPNVYNRTHTYTNVKMLKMASFYRHMVD